MKELERLLVQALVNRDFLSKLQQENYDPLTEFSLTDQETQILNNLRLVHSGAGLSTVVSASAEAAARLFPELRTRGLNPSRVEPKLERVAAKLERVAPKLERVAPKLERVEPKLERTAPKLERVAPKLERVEPKLERVAPKLERVAPKLERVEAKLARVENKLD